MSVLSVNKAKASQTMTADICSPLIGQRSLMFISSKNTGWEVSFSSILTLTGTKAREKGSNQDICHNVHHIREWPRCHSLQVPINDSSSQRMDSACRVTTLTHIVQEIPIKHCVIHRELQQYLLIQWFSSISSHMPDWPAGVMTVVTLQCQEVIISGEQRKCTLIGSENNIFFFFSAHLVLMVIRRNFKPTIQYRYGPIDSLYI